MRCRFDDGHGEFPNGVSLRKHYDREHAGQHMPGPGTRRVTCDLCGESLSRGSFHGHTEKFHAGKAKFIDDGAASATSMPARSLVTTGTFVPASGVVPIRARAPFDGAQPGFCSMCNGSVRRKNIVAHLKHVHHVHAQYGQGASFWRAEPVEDLRAAVPAVVKMSAPAVVHNPSRLNGVDVIASADDLVLPAIRVMALPGEVVPIDALPALFKWRDATAEMLTSIRNEAQR